VAEISEHVHTREIKYHIRLELNEIAQHSSLLRYDPISSSRRRHINV
jgi:hypothetical protein